MQVYRCWKITFSGEALPSFCRRQTAALLWWLNFRMGSFAKDCLQPLVNRISIETLEKYWPCYICPIAQNLVTWLGIKDSLYI